MEYESTDKVLFSADGFGKFGVNRLSIPNDAADIPLPRTKRQNLHLYEKSLFPNSRSPPLYLII